MNSGAAFSPDQLYRYDLWRTWDESKGFVLYILLNPSTADANLDDPTITRCQRRAMKLGYGGIHVVNLFAWRSTDPLQLGKVSDPVGGMVNDATIIGAAEAAKLVICGWGVQHSQPLKSLLHHRSAEVKQLLRDAGIKLYALKLTMGGEPRHPLYLSYDLNPFHLDPLPA